ncbi:MAG: adenylate cyclase, partial [Bacteroidota bacterium]
MKLIEIKARCSNPSKVRQLLLQQPNIQFIGVDEQVDTYFKIPSGRLKLREGNIENSLIYY